MKDSSQHLSHSTTSGCLDDEKLIYFTQCSYFDAILDASQVESLMFHKNRDFDANGQLTAQTFCCIPVS